MSFAVFIKNWLYIIEVKMEQETTGFIVNREIYDHKNQERHNLKASPGLNEEVIRLISKSKNEPEWMLDKRLKAFEIFKKLKMPDWGPDISLLINDLNNITFFIDPDAKKNARSWDDVPEDIKKTFEKLGIPEAERKSLAGAGAQYECLTQDSNIYVNPKGFVKINKIKQGDYVYALDDKENKLKKAKVTAMMDKGVRPVFEITAGTKRLKATYNHPFLTLEHIKKPGNRRGRFYRRWKYLNELKKGD